jgi:hypothetical protein
MEVIVVKQRQNLEAVWAGGKKEGAECRLHPLIHTRLEFTLAQDMVRRQEEF